MADWHQRVFSTSMQIALLICIAIMAKPFFSSYSQDNDPVLQLQKTLQDNPTWFWPFVAMVGLVLISYVNSFLISSPKKKKSVYLLDFSVYKPQDSLKITHNEFVAGQRHVKNITDDSVQFCEKVVRRSGVGNEAYFPPQIMQNITDRKIERPTIQAAREEFQQSAFGAISDLLQKTGVKGQDIGIVVVNCSLFNPTPSLSSMVVSNFGMKSDVQSYNLAGMGCSAGVVAVDLAQRLMSTKSNTYALVVSTENITQNWYHGNQRSMLVQNCIFRMGAAAVLLTNKASEKKNAKYRLDQILRTTIGTPQAQHCVFQKEDSEGHMGVELAKDLTRVVGVALKKNMQCLAPLVLPFSEQAKYVIVDIMRKLGSKRKAYTPDFKKAFSHFCIHTGGRAVIEAMSENLSLTPQQAEPAKASLWRYGNVSSASIWYVLAYIEHFNGVRKGENVWQLGFGSGFKVNSQVWKSLKNNKHTHTAWTEWDREKAFEDIDMLYGLK